MLTVNIKSKFNGETLEYNSVEVYQDGSLMYFISPQKDHLNATHLVINFGEYNARGFFPNVLEIIGLLNGINTSIKLPLDKCIITEQKNL